MSSGPPPKRQKQSLLTFDTDNAFTKGGITRFGSFSLHARWKVSSVYV